MQKVTLDTTQISSPYTLNLPSGVGTADQILKTDGSGNLSWTTEYSYTLPTASSSTLGGVKIDGTTITINGSGVITANYPDTLAELTDTNVSGASNNQVLTWNTSTSKWIPTTVNGVDTLPTGIAYYGSFYDISATQTATSLTTAYVIAIGQTAEANGVSIVSGNRITFAYAGTYEIEYSLQFHNVETQGSDVNVWFRKNGTDIADSNSRFTIPSKQDNNGYLIAVTPYLVTVAAGDYVQIVWSAEDNTTTKIETLAAGTTPTVPRTPGVIVLVSPVTALIVPTTVASLTVTGDISTGSLTTTQTTFPLVNTNATTVNFAGAATTLNMGASTGTTTINNNLSMGSGKTIGTTASITSNAVTAFIAGDNSISGVALQLPSEGALRNLTNGLTNMYFDVSIGGTTNGQFQFRSSSSYTNVLTMSPTAFNVSTDAVVTSRTPSFGRLPFNSAIDTELTIDGMRFRVSNQGGIFPQVIGNGASRNLAWTVVAARSGSAVTQAGSTGTIVASNAWTSLYTLGGMDSAGDTFTATLQDKALSRIYRITFMRSDNGSTTGYNIIAERLL